MIIIRISNTYRPYLTVDELFDATRESLLWGERREKARYAIPVYEGVALKAYKRNSVGAGWKHVLKD